MKRTALKQKTKIRKVGKLPISKIQKILWQECRRIADTRWKPICYTCDKPISGSNKQLGHFIPKSICGASLKYDMRNLRWQCYNCNINLGGNGAEFYRRMVKEVGEVQVEVLFQDKHKIVKAYDFYVDTLEKYKGL